MAAVLQDGVGWPRPGSGRGKPPLVDEDRACSVDSIFPWRCHTALRQAASSEKVAACVRVLVLRRSALVERIVFACIAVFAFALLSRRSSRPVLHNLHIRGTAKLRDPFVSRSLHSVHSKSHERNASLKSGRYRVQMC